MSAPDAQPKPFTLLQKVLLIALVFGTPVVIWYVNRPSAASTPKTVTLNVLTAATSTSFTCGVSTVKDADNNVYNTVPLGTQCWMKQNMRVGTMVTVATTQTNNGTIEKWCYGNTLANCMTNNNPNQPDGGLYQWNEAMQYVSTPGARGICPQGWHIPTDAEQYTLENYLKDNGQTCNASRSAAWDCSTAGTKLKPNGTSGWEGNLAGFANSGLVSDRGSSGFFWSSSESGVNAWYRALASSDAQISRLSNSKVLGFSVRCLRDSPATTINQTLPNPTLDSGLVGHWTFDGPNIDWSSTTAEIRDTSGNNNHGDAQNGISQRSVTPGALGQAIRPIKGSTELINAGSKTSLDNITTISVSVWFTNQGLQGYNRMIGKGLGVAWGWGLNVDNNNIAWVREFSGNDGWWDSQVLTFGTNEWHHAVVTYDDASASNTPRMYFDGQAVTVSTSSTPTNSASDESAGNLVIGNYPTADGAFHGVLDDVRIYNRALSAAEVKRLYDLGQGVTVQADIVCGASTVKDADGNVYNTVKIGEQCWMKQNMRVGTMVTVATTQTNNGTIEKWCYSNTLANCMTNNNPNQPDGGLYQWNEAMQYSTTPGARGICPVGFHIPTDAEQYTLENYLKDNGQTCNASRVAAYDCSTAGTKLKPNGTSGWEGNLAGYGISGSFDSRGAEGDFWSSSESGGNAWYRFLGSAEARVYRDSNGKSYGFSVRCLRD